MIQEEPPKSLVNGCKSPLRQTSKVSASDSVEDGSARENNLYVKNLPPDVDDARLERTFNDHGTVLSCRVLYDHNNRSKQVAFVQMHTHQQALKSIEALHGMQSPPGSKPLHVALALNKTDRQRKARQATRARTLNGDARSEWSWQTARQGPPSSPHPRQGRPHSSFNPYAGSFFPSGAGPFYVAHFVPYTPANYATHQPPPGAFAYPAGMPTPGPVLGMLAPTNGHASQHMLPMGPYAYQQPGPPYMHNAIGPPSHNPGTWAPQSGNWPMQGGYAATKVNQPEAVPTYAQQQCMVPMIPGHAYEQQQWRN